MFVMKIVFGLGNPGVEYNNTRHNIGFGFVDYIASSNDFIFNSAKFGASLLEYVINGEKVLLVKPMKYINLSGEVVKKFVDYYKLSLDDILVIHDDMDMSFGRVKFVYDSSSGGHNGIKNIEMQLGSKRYLRLKIGIAKNSDMGAKDYVLGKMSKNDIDKIMVVYEKLVNVVDDFVTLSKEQLMSKYNGK